MNDFQDILISHSGFEFLVLLALTTVKITFLLAFVNLLCSVTRRFSAATRHLLWASVLCASLLLPFLSFAQIWELPILPAPESVLDLSVSNELTGNNEIQKISETRLSQNLPVLFEESDNAGEKSEFQANIESFEYFPPPTNISEPLTSPNNVSLPKNATALLPHLVNYALAVWLAGIMLLLFRLLIGLAATNSLTRRADRFKEPELTELFSSLLIKFNLKRTVRLLRSERTAMPVVCGILRPVILLPADAQNWSAERQRMVLLHELAHVARRDCLTQMLAQIACAFYWFNPFVWSAARRLRIEREQACDNYVLSIGTKPSEYAHHLLEIARSMQEERSVFEWTRTSSVAIARRSQLEGRLLAILSKETKCNAVSRTVTAGLVALICLLFVSLAVIHPTVIEAQKSQTSATDLNAEKNKTKISLLDSFLASGLKQEDSAKTHNSEANKEARKQEDTESANSNSHEQEINKQQIDADDEQNVTGITVNHLKQNISENVRQQTDESVSPPEIPPMPNPVSAPFINAEYRQDGNRQTQNKSEDFIEEMASVGYTNLSIDELIRLKTAGVTADYVKNLQALGFANLTVKEIASMGIHNVTTAYIQAIRSAGYDNLSAKELTNFRIHDITIEDIKSLRDAGYGNLTAKQLTEFTVHQITPAFIKAIRAVGYGNLSPKEIVSLRVHGITPEFVRQARSRLGELSIQQLISVKNTGVLDDDKDKNKR